MCCTNAIRDGDQSPLSDNDASVTGQAVSEADSSTAKSPDQSTIQAYLRLKALAVGHLETPVEADLGDSGVTKVLNSDSAIPSTANKVEEIAERLRFETPVLVQSKLGEIFV